MIDASPFGALPDGRPVTAYRLGEPDGLVVTVLDRGATIHRLEVPGPDAHPVNLALGLAGIDDYLASDAYFGAVVGRYANRIAGSRFVLDGMTYRLTANDGANCLHGGTEGFDARLWDVVAAPNLDAPRDRLTLRLISPDGDQGFPGRLEVLATYRVEGAVLTLDLQAVTDAPTVVNLANHVYLNLAGEGAGGIDGHTLTVAADRYLPVNESSLPWGRLDPVEGTPLDLRTPAVLGERIRNDHEQIGRMGGLDHSFHLNGAGFRSAATLADPVSGRSVEVLTDNPAVQVYTANFLDGAMVGTGGRRYRQGDGIALETQNHPDAPNLAPDHPQLPSPVLRPGQRYAARTQWRFNW